MPHSAAGFGEEPNPNHHPANVFSRSCPMQLVALPKTHYWEKKSQFCICARNSMVHNSQSYSRTKKRSARGAFHNDMTAGAHLLKASTSSVTRLCHMHILFSTHCVRLQKPYKHPIYPFCHTEPRYVISYLFLKVL